MPQSAIPVYRFGGAVPLPLEASFDGGRLTSDGGLPWLDQADEALGVCAALAVVIPEWRRGPVHHALAALIRQRVFQIACGYEDQDDADTLRTDPLLKLVGGQLPETGHDLASQPTFSRLENAVDRRTCYRLAVALGEVYLRERERDGIPTRIILDLDGTDDPTHGQQEGSAYHGYYRQHMLHPLLIFDGETGQLITVVLRPGNTHGSAGVKAVLKQVVRRLRERWPHVRLELRMDSAGAVPAIYDWCEATGIAYTIGLIANPRLAALAAPLVAEAQRERAATGAEKVRLLGETTYQAESWDHPRRVVIKAEALAKGPNTRFVVTSRADLPETLYDWYVDRGEAEGWIKDLKVACCADRLSDHRFWANQFRLLLHAASYWLLDTLRRWLAARRVARMQLDTLRLRLLKIGGRVWQQADRVRLRLAAGHPGQPLWDHLAAYHRLR
ncbi:MAG TPA: IS1380 family transposase [Propionibacteriaceae bacterium]|nr:IS1380 family transposase [Propionibacteriaceae bacterium]